MLDFFNKKLQEVNNEQPRSRAAEVLKNVSRTSEKSAAELRGINPKNPNEKERIELFKALKVDLKKLNNHPERSVMKNFVSSPGLILKSKNSLSRRS